MPDPTELTEYAKKVLEEAGVEWRKPDKPTVVPPVEIPEYYPGFGKELIQLGVEQRTAQQRVIAAQQNLANLQRSWSFTGPLRLPSPGETVYPILPFLGIVTQRDFDARKLQAQQEMEDALQNFKAVEWRQEVMTTLPNYLSLPDYKVQSPEDILQLIPLDTMTDADLAWLTSSFERLKHLSNVLPEGYDGDAIEAQTKILNEILTAPKLELRAVHHLTVEEIAKSFAFGVAELPKGMTEEDVRYMLGRMELEDEEMQSAKDWLATRAKDWALETDRLNLIRAGTVLAEAPELTPLEFGKLLVTQPMMATVQMLDKYFNLLPRPLASAAVIGVHRLFKTPEDVAAARLEEQYVYYRSMGESSWSAYASAFNDWDAPWYLKLGVEIFFDPVSYIGLGFATALTYKVGTGLTKIGLRAAGTRIGPWVGAIENGYITGADAIFKTGVKGVLAPIKGAFWLTGGGYQIPRTFTMMARNFARDSYMKLSSVLQKTYPEVRNMKGLTVKDAVDTGTNAIDQAIARPMEGWDAAVRAGAPMLEFDYIDNIAAARLARDIVPEVTFDTTRLARLNNEVLNMFSGQGERITAGKIIADLGQEATEDMVNKMATKLIAFKQKVADTAKDALKGDTATDVLMNMFNRLERIRYGNLQSPLTKYMQQAGRTASWHSRVADRILYSTAIVALERRLVMPIARWNLLFTNFGPYNFLENMQRSFLGGAEILYPKAYSGVHETNRLFKGLANAPYELQMFERGEARLAQALIDPKTGRTAVFIGGKVPFVTRGVTIPEKIPFLGGKPVGAKINIAGRDHMLASFQDGYDMWAHFNSMQVAFDYQTHYMKELARIAPDDMGKLVDVLAKHRTKLAGVKAISSKDAKDIERVLLQDATVSPAEIRAHADIDVLEFERRQISKELGKTFDKCTDVRMTTKKGIQDDVLDGSIFDNIDAKMTAYIEQERELSLISLRNQVNVLTDEADALIANPPRNLDEFLGDMQNITAMVEGTGERIHDYRKLTELRKAKLLPGEMDDFEVGSAKLLAEFMETSEEQLTKIMNQIRTHAEAVGLDEVQLARLADLDSISRLELENVLATRNKIAQIESIIPRTPKKSRNDRFWKQQRSQKSTIWDEFDTNARKFKSIRLRASRNFLQSVDKSVYTPDFVPEVVDFLTPNHLAYLYGATGDDLYRGLTRIQHHATIRPREDFILHTVEQADAYAMTLGKNAADIGFTDEAIGEVYDQLWRNLGVEPTILTPDSPTVMQMEEIRQEITRLHGALKLPGRAVPLEFNLGGSMRFVSGYEDILPTTLRELTEAETARISTILDKLPDINAPALRGVVVDSAMAPPTLGEFDISSGLMMLSKESIASERTVFHEIAHAVQASTVMDNPEFFSAYSRIVGKYAKDAKAIAAGEKLIMSEINEGVSGDLARYFADPSSVGVKLRRLFDDTLGAPTAPDIINYRKYINSVADDVEKLSMYRKPAPEIVRASAREIWDSFTAAEREAWASVAGLEKGLGRKRWTNISKRQQDELLVVKAEAIPEVPPTAGAPEWWATKESAMTRAREQHALSYPTYEDANIIDEGMRAFFPFWNYEMFRWRWLPRTALRTPGAMAGVAKYVSNTDQGYIPVPGTDLQTNILRGSVWMGGLRSFYLRDFPEYYDVMPGMEFLDYISRAGFFPGIHVMLPIVMFGAAEGKPELGQLAPAWMRTGLSGLRTLSPEHIGKVLEHIYPDRFRDYMVMLTLGEEGYDADEIWRKKQTGEKLTEEEEKLWLKAVARVDGVKGILMQQTGLFRIRPQEFTEIRSEMRQAIEEATGVPIPVQEQIDRNYPVTGKRFSDYYKLDIYQQKLLYEWETYRRWQGVITPLYPSSWQLLDVKIRDYYESVEKIYGDARTVGIYEDGELVRPSMVEVNRQWIEGEIGPDQWKALRSDIQGGLADAVRILGDSPAYKDVPKTFEERATMLEERGIPTPTQTPDQELLYYYYELRPEYKWNWESERMERDFDTYYAYIDILLETLNAPHRARLLERIQSDWTPMEKLYWQVSRDFMRPYRNLRDIVLQQYDPEEIQQIRRYEVASAAEREQLQEIMGPEGEKLISGFQRRLREARQRLRILDSSMDAWLNFFGTTTALLSTEAEVKYEEMRDKYLVKNMVQ